MVKLVFVRGDYENASEFPSVEAARRYLSTLKESGAKLAITWHPHDQVNLSEDPSYISDRATQIWCTAEQEVDG